MKRREFITLIGGVAVVWSFAVRAQQAKIPRIGYLTDEVIPGPFYSRELILSVLLELGYLDGRNIVIEYRSSEGRDDHLSALAAELVRLHVDIILAIGTAAALAAKSATQRIPIVFARAADPIASGVVTGLSRPGGNITGVTDIMIELAAKRLELLKQALPGLTRVAVLFDEGFPTSDLELKEVEAAAKSLDVRVHPVAIRRSAELEAAFTELMKQSPGALFVGATPFLNAQFRRVMELVSSHHLPTVFWRREYVEAGGLMSYGTNYREMYRTSVGYLDRILKGAKPADLPVQQPTRFELVINLKTAKALGITIPPLIIERADEVIE
jgi:putative tryptophan/tyrosine transport system substrate-binding protein